MLRPADRGPADPAHDRSIGELAQQLLDDGRAYVEAEVALAKAKAEAQVRTYRRPAILAGSAAVAGLATLVALAVALVIVLAWLIGVVIGALVAVLLLAGLATVLALAARRALAQARNPARD